MNAFLQPTATELFAFREACPDDADLIHELTQASYAEYGTTDAPSSVTQERAGDLRVALASGEILAFVAEHDEQAVGSVRYRFEDGGDTLYFFRLGVSPKARGVGIARQMVAKLEVQAVKRGATRLRCAVRLNVARNTALYEALGFVRVGEPWLVRRGDTDVVTGTMEMVTSPPGPLSEAERGSEKASDFDDNLTRLRQIVVGQRVTEGKVDLSKAMRRAMTPEETAVWGCLRRNALGGLKFRRQQIIDGYIADFYCHSASLVIELDGAYHVAEYDERRDSVLTQRGLRVLRFKNDLVRRDMSTVIATIAEAAGIHLYQDISKR